MKKLLLLLLAVPLFVFAAIKPVDEYRVNRYDGGYTGWSPSLESACSAVGSGGPIGGDGIASYNGGTVISGVCYYKYKSGYTSTINAPHSVRQSCPANSDLVSGACVCKPGFTEKNGACVGPEQCVAPLVEVNGKCSCPAGTKEETDANGLRQCKPDSVCSEMAGKPLGLPVTADYGSKSPSSLGRMIGNSSTTCFPGGCSVSGTVDGCWSAKGVAIDPAL